MCPQPCVSNESLFGESRHAISHERGIPLICPGPIGRRHRLADSPLTALVVDSVLQPLVHVLRTEAVVRGPSDIDPDPWAPAVVDETVYVGGASSKVCAVDARSGEEQWRAAANMSSEPSVANGSVYAGFYKSHVAALDAASGEEEWRFDADDVVAIAPAVVDGTVYVGSTDHTVYVLDADSGTQQWQFETNDRVWSSPAVSAGTVFVGSTDGTVYAVDADWSAQQWRFDTGHSAVEGAPAVVDGTVYVASRGADGPGNLHAVDATSGDERWRFETGGASPELSTARSI